MAAPATTAILEERLYALGVEAEELRAACVGAGKSNTAKILDRFTREFNQGRGAASVEADTGADFAARSAAELSAHIATLIDTSDTTATIASLTAVIEAVGQDGDIEVEAID